MRLTEKNVGIALALIDALKNPGAYEAKLQQLGDVARKIEEGKKALNDAADLHDKAIAALEAREAAVRSRELEVINGEAALTHAQTVHENKTRVLMADSDNLLEGQKKLAEEQRKHQQQRDDFMAYMGNEQKRLEKLEKELEKREAAVRGLETQLMHDRRVLDEKLSKMKELAA